MAAPVTAEKIVLNELLDHQVENQLIIRLGRQVRNFHMTPGSYGLILHGHVPSFFGKQMAQEVTMEVTGLLVEANQIDVF